MISDMQLCILRCRDIEGEARAVGAKRPSIEGVARASRAKPEKKAGGGVWGGGSVSPSPEIF